MAIFKYVELDREGELLIDPRNVEIIRREIYYILDGNKMLSGYWGKTNCKSSDIEYMVLQFQTLCNIYGNYNSKKICHFVLSFSNEEKWITPQNACRIAQEICNAYGGEHGYQTMFAVHENSQQLHIHFLINPFRISDGQIYSMTYEHIHEIRCIVREVLKDSYRWGGVRSVILYEPDY
jgi:hypothetical protein